MRGAVKCACFQPPNAKALMRYPPCCGSGRIRKLPLKHLDHLHRSLDPDRLGVDHSRSREVANVDLPVQTGLADPDRGADVSAESWNSDTRCNEGDKQAFHGCSLLMGSFEARMARRPDSRVRPMLGMARDKSAETIPDCEQVHSPGTCRCHFGVVANSRLCRTVQMGPDSGAYPDNTGSVQPAITADRSVGPIAEK